MEIDLQAPRVEIYLHKSRIYFVNILLVFVILFFIFCFFTVDVESSDNYSYLGVIATLSVIVIRNFHKTANSEKVGLIVDKNGITRQYDKIADTVLWRNMDKIELDWIREEHRDFEKFVIVVYLKNMGDDSKFYIEPSKLNIKYEDLFALLKRRLDAYNEKN